ncbi:MAG: hypothetical protein Q8873_00425 [Bacillota bacterium]|nr:hypothetical protein [Bacillota bacterium]
MAELDRKCILEMAMGAIQERADYEMAKIIDNILDVNTKAAKKRTLTITVDLIPDEERRQIRVNAVAKSKLEPTNPIATSLYLTGDSNGEMVAVEMVPQVPGQRAIDGSEQEQPKVLRLLKQA